MKKFVSILMIASSLVGLAGCTDWLTIKPENDTVLEDYWQKEEDVDQVVAGCYRAMLEYEFIERIMCWGEIRSDNVVIGNVMLIDMYNMLNGDITSSNYLSKWGSAYSIINICNTYLRFAPSVMELDPKFTKDDYLKYEAEVLSIRALVYFYLVRTYQEVPWVDDPSVTDGQDYRIPKSTEDEVLDKIVADLLYAKQSIPTQYAETAFTKGRFTLNAINSLLADIYLWREQFEDCVAACDAVLDDKSLKLVNGDVLLYNVFYVKNSSESVFELQFDDKIIWNGAVRNFYGSQGNIQRSWSFDNNLVKGERSPFNKTVGSGKESVNDIRALDFFQPITSTNPVNYVFKYAGVNRFTNSNGTSTYNLRNNTANWIIYRLADVMLMKAEALVQLNRSTADLQGALDMVNGTYLRSNPTLASDSLTLASYGSPVELEELVLRERQRELMFEGKRWFDLVRLARRANTPSVVLGYVSKGGSSSGSQGASKLSTMDALYMPIHVDELAANSNLVQNPFYEVNDDTSTSK